MKSQKNFAKIFSRLEARKFGLGLFVGCCITVLSYYVFYSEPAGNQQKITASEVLRIDRISEGGVMNTEQLVKTVKNIESSSKQSENKRTEDSVGHETNKTAYKETSLAVVQLNPKTETVQYKKPEDRIVEDMKPPAKPICDLTNSRTEVCKFEGDVRVHGKSNTISLIDNHHRYSSEINEWSIRPYARKRLDNVPKVSVKLLHDHVGAPRCSVNHTKPAIVFANGGFTGNYYHDYTDIIVPLFTTARKFYGEVHFVVNNIKVWWLIKYDHMIKGLSRYQIIDFDHDEQVHCFPYIIVGMYFHNDITIDPRRPPGGLSSVDFTKFLRTSYSLPRESAINLRKQPEKKPRLLIISRRWSRKFTNVKQIVKMAKKLNFEVVAEDQAFGANIPSVASFINTFDVMMGVHGAGLTNLVFLPTNAVLIQIVPLGKLENMCMYDFGYPSMDAKLNYLQYSICEDESTLIEDYPRDHAVFTDPMSIKNLGWDEMGKIYLLKQNVKLDVNRFRPVLQEALERLRR